MRSPIIISLLSLFLLCSVLALPLGTTESNDLSLTSRSDDCEPGEICLVRRKKTNAAKARTAAKKQARVDGKADRAAANKKAGEAAKQGKSSAQIKDARKDRKKTKAAAKKTRVDKAKAKNPNYAMDKAKSRFEKNMKDPKVKVAFAPGASNYLDSLGLHGKDRKKAKKFHKGVIKNEMKKPGMEDYKKATIKATGHEGGQKANERYHVTAEFSDSKGRLKQNTYKDENGKDKQGPGHHIYVDKDTKAKGHAAYKKAYDAVPAEQRAASQKAYTEKMENRQKEVERQKQEAANRKAAKQAKSAERSAAKKAKQEGKKDEVQKEREARKEAARKNSGSSDMGLGLFDT